MKKVLEDYLLKQIEVDELFKKNYEKENRGVDGCFKYICRIARQKAEDGKYVMSDEEFYHLAREYFELSDEDLDIIFKTKQKAKKPNKTKEVKEEKPVEPKKSKKPKKEEVYIQLGLFD